MYPVIEVIPVLTGAQESIGYYNEKPRFATKLEAGLIENEIEINPVQNRPGAVLDGYFCLYLDGMLKIYRELV